MHPPPPIFENNSEKAVSFNHGSKKRVERNALKPNGVFYASWSIPKAYSPLSG
jgi:hypothetical protein